jgi:hypothetical protein
MTERHHGEEEIFGVGARDRSQRGHDLVDNPPRAHGAVLQRDDTNRLQPLPGDQPRQVGVGRDCIEVPAREVPDGGCPLSDHGDGIQCGVEALGENEFEQCRFAAEVRVDTLAIHPRPAGDLVDPSAGEAMDCELRRRRIEQQSLRPFGIPRHLSDASERTPSEICILGNTLSNLMVGEFVEHDGRALAADETDSHHHRPPGVASVHVRAVVTWCAIFPLVAAGMSIMAWTAADWPPALRALILTAIVVPLAVYVVVPQLLRVYAALARARTRRRGPAPAPTR